MSLISGSVGRNGENITQDVITVQRLLNKHIFAALPELSVDGIAGKKTIEAIEYFQLNIVKMRSPDGRVDPGGQTLRYLNRGPDQSQSGQSQSQPEASPTKGNLSGKDWWYKNQAKYPNSRELKDLDGNFRENVTRFIEALRSAGASIDIASTRRNKIRAHLMHYSWKVSRGDIQPGDVPNLADLDIEWDHGNISESRKAAGEMVQLFNMAHIASLTSNHIQGLAIDMTITWKGDLVIEVPGQERKTYINTGPKNGADNRELHQAGRSFSVLKLLNDPPHWSHNGR